MDYYKEDELHLSQTQYKAGAILLQRILKIHMPLFWELESLGISPSNV